MNTLDYRGTVYRLPFAPLFRPLTAAEEGELRQSVKTLGVLSPVFAYDSATFGPDCLIDGANRLRIAGEYDRPAPVNKVPLLADDTARRMAEDLNIARRHVSREEATAARAARIERVVLARAAGASLRAIAEAEEVSLVQIQRDIEETAESGVPGGTPDAEESENPSGVPGGTPEFPDEVRGRDGKTYPTRRTPPPVPTRQPETHPHYELLNQIVSWAARIAQECNDAEADSKLRAYLLYIGFVVPRQKIVRDKKYGWRCTGLRNLYRAVKWAGSRGKKLTKPEFFKRVENDEAKEFQS